MLLDKNKTTMHHFADNFRVWVGGQSCILFKFERPFGCFELTINREICQFTTLKKVIPYCIKSAKLSLHPGMQYGANGTNLTGKKLSCFRRSQGNVVCTVVYVESR